MERQLPEWATIGVLEDVQPFSNIFLEGWELYSAEYYNWNDHLVLVAEPSGGVKEWACTAMCSWAHCF